MENWIGLLTISFIGESVTFLLDDTWMNFEKFQKKGRSQMETPPGKNQFYHHLRTFVQCIT